MPQVPCNKHLRAASAIWTLFVVGLAVSYSIRIPVRITLLAAEPLDASVLLWTLAATLTIGAAGTIASSLCSRQLSLRTGLAAALLAGLALLGMELYAGTTVSLPYVTFLVLAGALASPAILVAQARPNVALAVVAGLASRRHILPSILPLFRAPGPPLGKRPPWAHRRSAVFWYVCNRGDHGNHQGMYSAW